MGTLGLGCLAFVSCDVYLSVEMLLVPVLVMSRVNPLNLKATSNSTHTSHLTSLLPRPLFVTAAAAACASGCSCIPFINSANCSCISLFILSTCLCVTYCTILRLRLFTALVIKPLNTIDSKIMSNVLANVWRPWTLEPKYSEKGRDGDGDGTVCAMTRFVGGSGSGNGAIVMGSVVHESTSQVRSMLRLQR